MRVVSQKRKVLGISLICVTKAEKIRPRAPRQIFVELNCSTTNYCFSILVGFTKVMVCLGVRGRERCHNEDQESSRSTVFNIFCTFSSNAL